MEQSCSNCEYFKGGVCKAFPPFNNVWPAVSATDWCGKWCPVCLETPGAEAQIESSKD